MRRARSSPRNALRRWPGRAPSAVGNCLRRQSSAPSVRTRPGYLPRRLRLSDSTPRSPLTSPAWILAQRDEASEALNRLQEGEQLLERQAVTGLVDHRGGDYHALERACLLLGRLDEARSSGNRAVDIEPVGTGRDVTEQVQRVGREPGVTRRGLGGKLYRRTGKQHEAHKHLTTATTMYREMDMQFWLEKAEADRDA